jgi:putative aldouronate transport system substrate-binding protein
LILDKATGKVTAAYTRPEYLEGLKFIRSLVVEGLLDPVSLTQTQQEYQVMGEAEPSVVGDYLGSNFVWLTLKDEKYRNFEAIPPLTGVTTGKKQTYANGYITLSNAVFMITKSCQNPEAAFRWADFQYSYDNSMLSRYALKGVDWVPADPGTKGPFGDPAVFREVGQWGAPTKNSNRQMFMYLSYDLLNGLQMTDTKGVSVNSDAHYVLRTSKYMDVGISNGVPRVFILPTEVDEYGGLSSTLTTYVAESFARFIAGDLPLSDWDKYQAELKKIGVDRFTQMTETAYKRQYMK